MTTVELIGGGSNARVASDDPAVVGYLSGLPGTGVPGSEWAISNGPGSWECGVVAARVVAAMTSEE